jgi:diazepam-binding inhibitor (GABA receptor modulating acyl-CoA-binding protein)
MGAEESRPAQLSADGQAPEPRPEYSVQLDPYFEKGRESSTVEQAMLADVLRGVLAASSQGNTGVAVTRDGSVELSSGAVPVELYEMKQTSGVGGRSVHACWRIIAGTEYTIEIKHTHQLGGELKIWANGSCESENAALIWDTGGKHQFKVAGLECSLEARLEGSLVSAYSQFYTYRLTVDGRRITDTTLGKPGDVTKDLMIAFYSKHDPKNIPRINEIMEAYDSNTLVEKLMAKYGASPLGMALAVEAVNISKESLTKFYQKYEPGNVKRADEILAAYTNKELTQALYAKYGAVPDGPKAGAAGATISKASLVAFYQKYEPGNIGRVDEILSAYSAAELKAALMKKYGAVPSSGAPFKSAGAAPAKSLGSAVITKVALTAFYLKHDPDAIARVDEILAAYSPAELSTALRKKYGESPTDGAAGGSTVASEFKVAQLELQKYDEEFTRPQEKSFATQALYRQATIGDCNEASPGMFDAEGQARWGAWNKLKGIPKAIAMTMFTAEVSLQVRGEEVELKQHSHTGNVLFDAVVKEVAKYDEKFERTPQEQYRTYALYQQATIGNCSDSTKPGIFDDAEKSEKWNAWKRLEGTSKKQAGQQFVMEAKRQMCPKS